MADSNVKLGKTVKIRHVLFPRPHLPRHFTASAEYWFLYYFIKLLWVLFKFFVVKIPKWIYKFLRWALK